ncbi:hypothetical protein [Candidatus Protochlamydia sp. W-9]|uniref:hypothetical protein n=1 Tax=Candidatus Protochlamydia sp. W-9 TaxID=1785087 RepID=UPI00096A6B12|nr:hypothetical protein [Candidatus Protochlamydia sp. W-9]
MINYFHLAQKIMFFCAIFNLSSCSQASRQWQYHPVLTDSPRFNFGRLFLPANSDPARLTMEIVKGRSGIRLYLNILFLQAPPCKEDPTLTKVDLFFEDKIISLYPQILQGGQKLLFSSNDTNYIIQTLLDNLPFTIKFGRHELYIPLENFSKSYNKLMSLTVETYPPTY